MNFDVSWQLEAEEHLAELWLLSEDRMSFTQAANRIERTLEREADSAGESRDTDVRILFEPPLAVLYQVFSQENKVKDVYVGWSGKPL